MSKNTSKKQPRPSVRRVVRRYAQVWETERKIRDWSLRDASQASGVSASQINRFEHGMDISLSTLEKLLASVNLALCTVYCPPAEAINAADSNPPNTDYTK